jgi:hypothetical protein
VGNATPLGKRLDTHFIGGYLLPELCRWEDNFKIDIKVIACSNRILRCLALEYFSLVAVMNHGTELLSTVKGRTFLDCMYGCELQKDCPCSQLFVVKFRSTYFVNMFPC